MLSGTRVARVLSMAGLWCVMAVVLAAGVLWAAGPTKKSSAYRSTSDHIVPVGLRSSNASSPGIVICSFNSYDFQHFDGTVRQLATLGGGSLVHFGWMNLDYIPDSLTSLDRFVNYNAYSPVGGLALGDCGWTLPGAHGPDPLLARAGYIGVEVGSDDNAHPVFHMRNEVNQVPGSPQIYSSFVFDQGIPGFDLFSDNELPGSVDAEAIYPHSAIDRGGSATKTPGDDVFHVVSRTQGEPELLPFTEELFYWRRMGVTGTWEGPVVLDLMTGGSLSHHIATDPTDENVAVVYTSFYGAQGLREVIYLESANNGADWLAAGVPIFPDPAGPWSTVDVV